MDTVAGRRRHTSPKKPRGLSEMAEERQERGIRGMYRDITDEPSAQRFSYARKVQKRQREKKRLGG